MGLESHMRTRSQVQRHNRVGRGEQTLGSSGGHLVPAAHILSPINPEAIQEAPKTPRNNSPPSPQMCCLRIDLESFWSDPIWFDLIWFDRANITNSAVNVIRKAWLSHTTSNAIRLQQSALSASGVFFEPRNVCYGIFHQTSATNFGICTNTVDR